MLIETTIEIIPITIQVLQLEKMCYVTSKLIVQIKFQRYHLRDKKTMFFV